MHGKICHNVQIVDLFVARPKSKVTNLSKPKKVPSTQTSYKLEATSRKSLGEYAILKSSNVWYRVRSRVNITWII